MNGVGEGESGGDLVEAKLGSRLLSIIAAKTTTRLTRRGTTMGSNVDARGV